MARQAVFSVPTKLWHPAGGWREFPAGETDPGGAWHEKEGGEAPGSNTTAQALKDLIAAQEQIEALQATADRQAYDMGLARTAQEQAEAKVAGLEQRAISAETKAQEAETRSAQYMRERDDARKQLKQASAAPEGAAAKA